SAALASEQIEFLGHKYRTRNIGVIVTSGPSSMASALTLRERMASSAPVVHVAMPLDSLAGLALPPYVVGRAIDQDPTRTIRLAMQLHPGVKRVVVVLGASERDRVWDRRVREAAGRIIEGPDFEYIAGLPTAEILRRVGALTSGTVVYTPGY